MLGYAIGEHALGSVRGPGITTLVRGDPSVGGDAVSTLPDYWWVPDEAGQEWVQVLDCGLDADKVLLNPAATCGAVVAAEDADEPPYIPWAVEGVRHPELDLYRWRVNWYNKRRLYASTESLAVANPGAESSDMSAWTVWHVSDDTQFGRTSNFPSYEGSLKYWMRQDIELGHPEPVVSQDIALPNNAGQHDIIDQGGSVLLLGWHQYQGDSFYGDIHRYYLRAECEFYDSSMTIIGGRWIGEWNTTPDLTWQGKQQVINVPAGSRTVRLFFHAYRAPDMYNQVYPVLFDAITLDLDLRSVEHRIQQVWECWSSQQPAAYPRPNPYWRPIQP